MAQYQQRPKLFKNLPKIQRPSQLKRFPRISRTLVQSRTDLTDEYLRQLTCNSASILTNITAMSLQEFIFPPTVNCYSIFKVMKHKGTEANLIHTEGSQEQHSDIHNFNTWGQKLSHKETSILDDCPWDKDKQIKTGLTHAGKAVNEFINAHKNNATMRHHVAKY